MPCGGTREWRVEAGESDAWRHERVPRGGMREWRVEAAESDAWRHESTTWTGEVIRGAAHGCGRTCYHRLPGAWVKGSRWSSAEWFLMKGA